jgi:hypothetical protein
MSNIKRNTSFWGWTIFSLWLFPAFGIYLLSTKNGTTTLKEFLIGFFKKPTIKSSFFKATKIFWISSIICILIVAISMFRQKSFNKPYFDKLLSKGEMDIEFPNYSGGDKKIFFKFHFNNGKVNTFESNVTAFDKLETNTGEFVYDTRLSSLKDFNSGNFDFIFETPENQNSEGSWKHEVEIKLKNDPSRYILGFWAFIPNLISPNLPAINADGHYEAEIKIFEIKTLNGKSRKDKKDFAKANGIVYLPQSLFLNDSLNTTNNPEINKPEVKKATIDNNVNTINLKDFEGKYISVNEEGGDCGMSINFMTIEGTLEGELKTSCPDQPVITTVLKNLKIDPKNGTVSYNMDGTQYTGDFIKRNNNIYDLKLKFSNYNSMYRNVKE